MKVEIYVKNQTNAAPLFYPFPNLQFVFTMNSSLQNLTHFSFNAFSVYSLIILKICLFIRFDKEESSFAPLFLCLVYDIMSMRPDAYDSIFSATVD